MVTVPSQETFCSCFQRGGKTAILRTKSEDLPSAINMKGACGITGARENKTLIYMIRKILVANRGEIAIRVMRSCYEMGIHSVAVYSTADRMSRHVLFANEAECIGEAASSDSYLNIDHIIAAAHKHSVDAIHPGY